MALSLFVLCMGFACTANAETNYVTSIAVSYGNKSSTAENPLKGYNIVRWNGSSDLFDFNDSAGGDYVYMGYKTSTSHSNLGQNDYAAVCGTGGSAKDVNAGTKGDARYLHMEVYSRTVTIHLKYILDTYSIWAPTIQTQLFYEGHEPEIVWKNSSGKDITPPLTVTYKNGYTYTLCGWTRGDNSRDPDNTVPVQLTRVSEDWDFLNAIYSRPVKITFDANGGSSCSESTIIGYVYENVSGFISNGILGDVMIQINQTASHSDPCMEFSGWSDDSNATLANYGNTTHIFSNDTVLYAVWRKNHSYQYTPAKAATCEEAGNSAYKTCIKCGRHFNDANQEIAKDS